MGFNPLTGEGTVWGAKQYGPAEAPNRRASKDVSEYSAFDRTPQVQALIKGLYGNLGSQQRQAGANASKLGIGRSSGTVGQMASLAANTEDRAKNAQYQAAEDTFKEQLAQKQFEDQLNESKYRSDLEKYRTDQSLNAAEDARRRSIWGPFAQFLS